MREVDSKEIYQIFTEAGNVSTDSRKCEKGSMFFALKGDNFDGNNFARAALDNGAGYAVIDNEEIYNSLVESDRDKYEQRVILVENALTALQQLARYNRLQHRIPVIAITGSNGKTTTKELITRVLATKYNVVATIGNLNNHIGVPMTLLRINDKTDVAVIEMGASAPGEIKMLSDIVCPSFGLITSVGKSHLLGFGSLEGVKKTKGELYANLTEYKRIAFVNVDNEILLEMLKEFPQLHIVPYGVKNNCARIVHDTESPFLRLVIPNPDIKDVNSGRTDGFEKKEIEVNTHLIGNYNADNVMAALSVASYFDIPSNAAVKAIESYVPSNNRSQLIKSGRNALIVDAYNANPTSMTAALENFRDLKFDHKELILGDMLELGQDSESEHRRILEFALSIKPERIYLVGDEFGKAAKSYCNIPAKLFSTSEELKGYFQTNIPENRTFLIKGSRGIRLEKILDVL